MKATYGQFTVEGSGAVPWSADDDRRLRGGWPRSDTPPHVMTLSGPFVIGRVPLPRPPSHAAIERVVAMTEWAAAKGDREAVAFYARRAASMLGPSSG